MRTAKILHTIGGIVVLICLAASVASASPFDRRTLFTFNRPIALPGITLPTGQYLFRIANASSVGDVVQVLSADGRTPYAMLFTIRDERPDATSRPEVRFMETAKGEPSAIEAWWYQGERTGWEFIYPKDQARLLAQGVVSPVLTTAAETTTAKETGTSDLRRLSKRGGETAVTATGKPAPMPVTGERLAGTKAPEGLKIAQAPTRAAAGRTELPKTASHLPLIGLIGLVALVGAGGLRFWRMARG